VIEFPTAAIFRDIAADPRFVAAMGAALLAGGVRGFSGFGAALIYVPLMSAFYSPPIATASLVIADYCSSAPFLVQSFRYCRWHAVAPAAIAGAAMVPIGTLIQKTADPYYLRWGMAAFVMAFVVILASGWRYRGPQGTAQAIGAGAMSGIAGGATQMSGPPLILFWLSSPHPASVVRYDLTACLALIGFTLCVSYAVQGLFTATPIAIAIMVWPIYMVSAYLGARWFRRASDRGYRRVAYLIIAISAVISMPIFDAWLR
jgi:uncharacterized membrane protein YfcA